MRSSRSRSCRSSSSTPPNVDASQNSSTACSKRSASYRIRSRCRRRHASEQNRAFGLRRTTGRPHSAHVTASAPSAATPDTQDSEPASDATPETHAGSQRSASGTDPNGEPSSSPRCSQDSPHASSPSQSRGSRDTTTTGHSDGPDEAGTRRPATTPRTYCTDRPRSAQPSDDPCVSRADFTRLPLSRESLASRDPAPYQKDGLATRSRCAYFSFGPEGLELVEGWCIGGVLVMVGGGFVVRPAVLRPPKTYA